jgi:hypothetical protein
MTAPATAGGQAFVSWTSGSTTRTTQTFCVAGAQNVQNWIANYAAAANTAPNGPATLGQFKSSGTTTIATGGATDETSVVLKASVSDPDAGNTVKLQVEVRPVGTAFSNTATAESGLLASGSTASVTISSLVNGTRYHWQARTVDNTGATSAWVSFGGNTEADTDFRVLADRPSVTINQQSGQADPTNSSPINFTVVFSEAITGFTGSDVTLTGTAGATTAAVSGSGTTYTVAVSGMAGDGTVIATVPAGVASDDAGNTNQASTSTDNEVSYDNTPPTVTINQAAGQGDPTNVSPINFSVVFSEPVSDFAIGDVTLSGTASPTTHAVTGSGTTYNVAVSGMTGDGTVIASIAAGKASDAVGNASTASTSSDNTVTYDATAPVVSCGSADGAWHAADVSIACTASDAVSGLANSADASFNLVTSVAAGTETSNASTDSRVVADAAGNSVTAGPIPGNMVDKKAPVLSLTCPLNPVILGTSARATWTAVDGGSGVSGVNASGSITLATSSVGQKQATAALGTSKDNVGNESAAVSCSYTVIYRWTGFFQPVDNGNLNVAKAGSAIPVKFSLNGNQGLAIFMSGSPSSVKVACSATYPTLDTVEQTVTAGGSTLTYDASTGQYVYVWKSLKTWVGQCRRLDVRLIDGTVHSAYFRFK